MLLLFSFQSSTFEYKLQLIKKILSYVRHTPFTQISTLLSRKKGIQRVSFCLCARLVNCAFANLLQLQGTNKRKLSVK